MNDVSFHNNRFLLILVSIIGIIIIVLLTFILLKDHNKCPKGFSLDGDRCVKTISMTPNRENYCDDGYVLNDNVCSKKETLDSIKNYSCANVASTDRIKVSSPTLLGSKCKYTWSYDAVKREECPVDCFLNTRTECTCRFVIPAAIQGVGEHQRLTCLSDYYLEGTNCVLYTHPAPTIKYLCTSDFSLHGTTCKKDMYEDAIVNLSCPIGYALNGYYCVKNTSYNAKSRYVCPPDYNLYGNECLKKIYVDLYD